MSTETTTVRKSQEVSIMLSVPNSRIIAGGTGLSADSADDIHLVDIGELEGLDKIRQKGNRIEIGPLARLQTLADSPLLKTFAPALMEAASLAGTPEVRSRATLGGNLASSRIGDTAVALLACGAKLNIRTGSDFREILIDRFWDQNGMNDLQYDEWINRISMQIPKEPRWGAAFGKTGEWDLHTDPAAAAAVQLSLDVNDRVISIRGGLRMGTANIRRMFPLEKILKNQILTNDNIEKAVRAMAPAANDKMDERDFIAFLTGIVHRSCLMAAERRIH